MQTKKPVKDSARTAKAGEVRKEPSSERQPRDKAYEEPWERRHGGMAGYFRHRNIFSH